MKPRYIAKPVLSDLFRLMLNVHSDELAVYNNVFKMKWRTFFEDDVAEALMDSVTLIEFYDGIYKELPMRVTKEGYELGRNVLAEIFDFKGEHRNDVGVIQDPANLTLEVTDYCALLVDKEGAQHLYFPVIAHWVDFNDMCNIVTPTEKFVFPTNENVTIIEYKPTSPKFGSIISRLNT